MTNAVHLFWRGRLCYAVASAWLTYTSVRLRHCFPRKPLDVNIDYLAVALFMVQGAHHWCRMTATDISPWYHLRIASTLGTCFLLYCFRCVRSTYEPLVDAYEAGVHVMASIGHHLIAWRLAQQ